MLSVGHESFAEGVPIGWDAPLPRTPQVFRPRLKQRQLDVTPFEPIMQDYASAEISSEQLEQQFRSDEQKGMMVCTTEAEAKRVYGEDGVLIAAMGAVAKSNGDVRPLHDGTHGIGLNNKIVVPDRLEVPGPAEIKEAVALAQESREAVFGISADISQAHRRVRVRKCDWGRLGCKSSRVLWLNTVGTFGVSSAAYWWTRLFACVGRWVLRIIAFLWNMQLVYVDDLHIVTAGRDKFATLWMIVLAWGVAVDFIGYHISISSWQAGVSEKRARWIVERVDQTERANWLVSGRALAEFVGRVTFVARMLVWLKPFLAPLYAWQAVVSRGTVARLPQMAHIVLCFIRKEFLQGMRLESVARPWPLLWQAFRADAKCAPGRIVLGGWSLTGGPDPSIAPSFSVEVLPADLPCLFKEDGSSQWASTAAEMLASYMASYAFGLLSDDSLKANLSVEVCAGTDNRSMPAVQEKGSSTKWPLLAVHMQMAKSLFKRNKICRLQWRPREENQEADDLTNGVFDRFDLSRRVPVKVSDLELDLLNLLVNSYEEFSKLKSIALSERTIEPKATKRQKMESKTAW